MPSPDSAAEQAARVEAVPRAGLKKAPTGIDGLDQITYGGLPRGRPTLVCGGAGCGKTLFATEFLVRGALQFGEPGVFMAFEESAEDLAGNVASLGFDLEAMIAKRQLVIDHVQVERSEIEETGEYNLDGLFIRIQLAVNEIGAKRIVLDTIETIFSGFRDDAILRAELRRLFHWLKDQGLTAVITGERGEGPQLTRRGLEEYVSDCVIVLDNRVAEQQSIRRLRIVKYRGSHHGTNEYPFLIDEDGFSVLPITTIGLEHEASDEIVSIGIPAIDRMLAPGGIYRGSSVLVSGSAGTGKTSVCAAFVDAACRRGERCLFVSFEESAAQIARNMRSIGMELQRWVERGLLHFDSTRPSSHGLEMHLVAIHKLVREHRPHVMVIDPITSLLAAGTSNQTESMLVRLLDFLKTCGVTALYTSLTPATHALESGVGVSSLIDTWMVLRQEEVGGERNRTLMVLKSRGMNHSNQVRELLLRDHGIELRDAYLGMHGVLTGSARLAREARDRDEQLRRREEIEKERETLAARHRVLEAQKVALEAELHAISRGLDRVGAIKARTQQLMTEDRQAMAQSRRADASPQGEER